MSKEGEGNTIVNFESLELEEEDESSSSKLNEMLSYLKEKLEPADYTEVLSKLGIDQDISNTELLAAFEKLLKGEKEEKKEDDEEEKEKDMAYKDFMKKCMEGGKSLKECAAEFKEKYPEPSKEEVAEVEELAKELAGKKKDEDEEEEDEEKDKLSELETRIAELEKEKRLAGISSKVEELVKEKHLAPVQKDMVIKLAEKLEPELQEDLVDFFRSTQKFSVHLDVGRTASIKPGEEGSDITAERRAELIELHGLQGLIDDKADKTKLPWRNN